MTIADQNIRQASDVPATCSQQGRATATILFTCLVLVLAGCSSSDSSLPTPGVSAKTERTPSLESAQLLMKQGDFAAAGQLISRGLVQDPEDFRWLELHGDLASLKQEHEQATEFYERAIQASDNPSVELFDKLGQAWMSSYRPFESLQVLRRAVEQHPGDASLRTKLGGLLAALGLERQAAEHFVWLVQRGQAGGPVLVLLSDLTRPQTDIQMCETVLQNHPQDKRPLFSLARLDAHHSRWEEVAAKLHPVLERYPDFVEAQAYYARAMAEKADRQAVTDSHQELPGQLIHDPEYLIAIGIEADRRGDSKVAAKAFWKATQVAPNHTEALSRLASSLGKLEIHSDQRDRLRQRVAAINRLRQLIDGISIRQFNSQKTAVAIAKEIDSLGRRWEAAAWLQLGATMSQDSDPTLRGEFQRIRSSMTGDTPWQDRVSLVSSEMDLSDFPEPSGTPFGQPVDPAIAESSQSNSIQFVDESETRNLVHRCRLRKPPGEEAGLWIYQSIACGAGVLDFDLDGWPDLYLTTMEGLPFQQDSGANRLFRNQSGQLTEATLEAQCGDRGYAQGVSIGDLNSDGFPDLCVANIGQNRLYQNNGDGTFTDVTSRAGILAKDWTTSIASLDLDLDGNLDLVEVGYCSGTEPFQKICPQDGVSRSCSPQNFTAERDRIWRGNGDGSFSDVSEQWMGDVTLGYGLGIVAGRFDELPGIDLYIANDMTPNHFWSSVETSDVGFRLQEQAVLRGLAVNGRSLAEASMGMAVGDPDLDGDIDFFLTHHVGESNTYYEQISAGQWVDHTDRLGLAAPSLPMVGFGTKWFDADNDGSLELMVSNGHVDDFSHLGDAYRMPMQVFHRGRDGGWSPLPAEQLGDYFQAGHVGRNLVNLDLNRDGACDALVTHLFDPVALLINRTESAGQSLTLFLQGTRGHRDAVGSIVTIEVAGQSMTSQLIAGDGFQCSSQKCIRFGLGSAKTVDHVQVEWPNGTRQDCGVLKAGAEYLIVEGQPPFELE